MILIKVLDLFSGLNGWGAAFKERGHEVISVDFNPDFKPTIVADILKLSINDLPGPFDVVLASPDCSCFSVASIGYHWENAGYGVCIPKTEAAKNAMKLIERTMNLIEELKPKFWVVENPVGKMRKLPVMKKYERRTVTWCQYGEKRMKPTDLWSNFPTTWNPKPRCFNGDSCHERAPAGSKTSGTQGIKDKALRAVIPYNLSLEVALAAGKLLTLDNPKSSQQKITEY